MHKLFPALLGLGLLVGAAALPKRRTLRPPEGDPAETIVLTARGLLPWPDMVTWARN